MEEPQINQHAGGGTPVSRGPRWSEIASICAFGTRIKVLFVKRRRILAEYLKPPNGSSDEIPFLFTRPCATPELVGRRGGCTFTA